jgi:hypothetical protein
MFLTGEITFYLIFMFTVLSGADQGGKFTNYSIFTFTHLHLHPLMAYIVS